MKLQPATGPENAESELRKAYSGVMEVGTYFFWDRRSAHSVNAYEALTLYKKAFEAFQNNNRLAAERWARAVKHLARAFAHEAKIAYIEPRTHELPFIQRGHASDYGASNRSDTAEDLLASVKARLLPRGKDEVSKLMARYHARGLRHLEEVKRAPSPFIELLGMERTQAAYEYGRVIECIVLAIEAEEPMKKTSSSIA